MCFDYCPSKPTSGCVRHQALSVSSKSTSWQLSISTGILFLAGTAWLQYLEARGVTRKPTRPWWLPLVAVFVPLFTQHVTWFLCHWGVSITQYCLMQYFHSLTSCSWKCASCATLLSVRVSTASRLPLHLDRGSSFVTRSRLQFCLTFFESHSNPS